MSKATEIKNDATNIIELIKQLPPEKQEYINGYVQGVADTHKDKSA